MTAALLIARQIAIMFLYMLIGFLLFRRGLVTKEGSRALAHLLLYCVLPCVIINSFLTERTAENTRQLLVSIGAGALLLLLSMAVAALLFRGSGIDNFAAAFSNAGFMGFPLITALLDSSAVFFAAGFVALLNALQWTYGQWLLSRDVRQIRLRAVLGNPIILSLFAGLVLFFTQIPLPGLVTDTVSALTALNAPLAMIILGVYLAQTDLLRMFRTGRLYWVSAVRLVLIPLLSLAVLMLLPAEYRDIKAALLLVAAAPVGSNVAVYAQKLNLDYTWAVQTVCVSTLLSIVTMPAIIFLMQTMGIW